MPLRGVRIVTVEEWLQLPWATVNLSEMGAEVIRVETLGRMVVRNLGPYPENKVGKRFWNQGGTHHTWSRSKKSLTLDLKTPEGADAFKELVSISDVVTENNRPGIMERFGLDYEALRQVKPDLIMLRTTGFGQTGEWREYGAFARTVEAVTSLSHMTGFPDGPPVRANTSYVDLTTCWNNMLVVLMALYHRNRTGEGAFIDMSMYESGVSNVGVGLLEQQATGSSPQRMGNLYQLPHQGSPLSSEGVDGIKDPLPASNPLDHFGVSGQLLEHGLNGSPFGGQGLIHLSFYLVTQELEDALSRIEFRRIRWLEYPSHRHALVCCPTVPSRAIPDYHLDPPIMPA